VRQPPRLDARRRRRRQQPPFREFRPDRFVEIFGETVGAGNRRHAVDQRERRDAFGGQRQKLAPPLPDLLFDEFRLDSIFGERNAQEARMRAKRVVIKGEHDPRRSRLNGA